MTGLSARGASTATDTTGSGLRPRALWAGLSTPAKRSADADRADPDGPGRPRTGGELCACRAVGQASERAGSRQPGRGKWQV